MDCVKRKLRSGIIKQDKLVKIVCTREKCEKNSDDVEFGDFAFYWSYVLDSSFIYKDLFSSTSFDDYCFYFIPYNEII